MSDTALLVLNERARGAAGRAALDDAVRVLRHAYRVRVVSPSSSEDLAATVASSDERLVIAAGGDGTVNAVVGALRPDAVLGILPVGTANDFACELGIPPQLEAAARQLVSHRGEAPRVADLLEVAGRPFCTVGGVGLVARTTVAVLDLKSGRGLQRWAAQRLGSVVYKLVSGATLLAGRNLVYPLQLEWRLGDGSWAVRDVRVHAAFVVNHRLCGGGLSLPTGSDGSDGIFELGLVHAGSRAALVRNFSRLAGGAAIDGRAFEVVPVQELVIRAAAPLDFAADGELLATACELRVTMRAGALRVAGARGR